MRDQKLSHSGVSYADTDQMSEAAANYRNLDLKNQALDKRAGNLETKKRPQNRAANAKPNRARAPALRPSPDRNPART